MWHTIQSASLNLAQLLNKRGFDLPNKTDDDALISDTISNILQITFAIAGAIAVLVITVAALQYVLSAGDTQKVARAKDAIIYAVIGLVVALLAFAIVRFILSRAF